MATTHSWLHSKCMRFRVLRHHHTKRYTAFFLTQYYTVESVTCTYVVWKTTRRYECILCKMTAYETNKENLSSRIILPAYYHTIALKTMACNAGLTNTQQVRTEDGEANGNQKESRIECVFTWKKSKANIASLWCGVWHGRAVLAAPRCRTGHPVHSVQIIN